MNPSAKPSQKRISVIVRDVRIETGVSEEAIRSPNASKFIAPARHQVWRKLNADGFGPSGIARAWGCHPSTVQVVLYGKPSSPLVNNASGFRGKTLNVASPEVSVGGNLST